MSRGQEYIWHFNFTDIAWDTLKKVNFSKIRIVHSLDIHNTSNTVTNMKNTNSAYVCIYTYVGVSISRVIVLTQ